MTPPIGPTISISQSKTSLNSGSTFHASKSVSKSISNANFWDAYEYMCILQSQSPLQFLKLSLSSDAGSNLVIEADKIKSSDWDPLFSALSINKTLKSIRIVSKYFPPNENDSKDRQLSLAKLKKPPSIRNRERANKLCRSLRDCLTVTTSLTRLEIFNIPFTVKDCVQLGKGLRLNKTLKSLSLDSCLIGDDGLIAICQEMQTTSNLIHLDLTSCQLTSVSSQTICDLIQSQSFKRHAEAWKDSLRYGRPDLDTMHGLRRLTLNRNPLIRDAGALTLATTLQNDLWLKALDLQQCGITNEGAKAFLEKLKGTNNGLYILDLRLNDGVDKQMIKNVMEMVIANGGSNGLNEFDWLQLGGRKLTGIEKKTTSRPDSSRPVQRRPVEKNLLSPKMKRSKSAGSLAQSKMSSEKGIPWRTAARATKNNRTAMTSRTNASKKDEIIERFFDQLTSSDFMRYADNKSKITKPSSYETNEDDLEFLREPRLVRKSGESIETSDSNSSVKELLLILRKEQETKAKLEDLLMKLQDENTQLKSEISALRSQPASKQESRSLLEDEKAFDIIELTLNKYQKFLDFLRVSGYGKLIDIGEEVTSSGRHNKKGQTKKSKAQTVPGDDLFSLISARSKKRPIKSVSNDELVEFNIKNRAFPANQTNIDQIDGQNYNIDNLLSNALEISRSFRKMNASNIDNNNDQSLSIDVRVQRKEDKYAREEENKSESSMSARKSGSKKISQQGLIQPVVSVGTPASSSPATTVIAANEKQPPPVTARSSRSSSKKSDVEQIVEDLSQILSDEEEEATTTKSGSPRKSSRSRKSDNDDQF